MKISRLVLGTVQFGLNYGIANTHGKPSDDQVADILSAAYNSGIRILDTAASYGESEQVLGRVLKRLGMLQEMCLVSKIPPIPPEMSRTEGEAMIDASLERSLKNLGVPSLYAILFHREENLDYLPVLRKWQEKGAVRFVGTSVDGALPLGIGDCDAVQIPSNVLDRRFLSLIKATDRKARVFVRSVYLQGLLLMPAERIPEHLQVVLPIRQALTALAEAAGMTLSELCMRYLLSFPGVEGVLTGVDTVEQLEMNVALAERGSLPEDLLKAVMAAVPDLAENIIRPSMWNKRN
ncbi:MAG: aldo/keto reductase [Victivallales bacterium]|nr:aldo/keto reductase [Victivallales bacterium]